MAKLTVKTEPTYILELDEEEAGRLADLSYSSEVTVPINLRFHHLFEGTAAAVDPLL